MLKNIIFIFMFFFSFLFYSCLADVSAKENIDFIKNSLSEGNISLGNIVFGKEDKNSILLFFDFIEKNNKPIGSSELFLSFFPQFSYATPNNVFTFEFPTSYGYEFKKMIFLINGKEYKSFSVKKNEANRVIVNKRINGEKLNKFVQDIYLEESIFKDSYWLSYLKALGKGKDSQIVFKDEEGFSYSITLTKEDKDILLKALSYYEKNYQSVYTDNLDTIFFNL